MTTLNVMCGCPGSGKTYYVKTHAQPEDLVVSRDAVRASMITSGVPYFSQEAEVFNEYCSQINAGIGKYDVIWADATHLNHKSRWKLLYNIEREKFDKIVFICMETPLEECLKRNANKPSSERTPESALRNMAHSYRRPVTSDFLSLNVEIKVIF